LKSKGISVSIIPTLHDLSPPSKESLELSGVEVVSGFEAIDANATSDKDLGKISDVISKNSSKKILISESNSTDMDHNRKLAEASNSKILLVSDSIDRVEKIKSELGEHLSGIIYNNIARHRMDSIRSGDDDRILSIIPENRYMVSSTVDQYAEHLKENIFMNLTRKTNLCLMC